MLIVLRNTLTNKCIHSNVWPNIWAPRGPSGWHIKLTITGGNTYEWFLSKGQKQSPLGSVKGKEQISHLFPSLYPWPCPAKWASWMPWTWSSISCTTAWWSTLEFLRSVMMQATKSIKKSRAYVEIIVRIMMLKNGKATLTWEIQEVALEFYSFQMKHYIFQNGERMIKREIIPGVRSQGLFGLMWRWPPPYLENKNQ